MNTFLDRQTINHTHIEGLIYSKVMYRPSKEEFANFVSTILDVTISYNDSMDSWFFKIQPGFDQKIVLERRNIYFQGYALGFAISLFVIYNNYIKLSSSRTKNQALSKFSLVCTVVSVTFIVSYFHYILHPKSDWMVKYLTTNQQKDAWLKIYRHMQLNCHIGAALGIVAVALYANSVCPYKAE